MDTDDLKRVTKLAFVVGLIFNLLIAIYCFQSIKYTSEFAGWLLNGFARIKIIFIGVFFTAVLSVLVRLMFKYWNENIVFILSIILGIAMCIGYYSISMSIINPKPLTEKQLIKNAIRRAEENKKEASKLLKEADLFIPNGESIARDKSTLEQSLKKLLLSFSEQSKYFTNMNDSVRLSNISKLWYYSNVDTTAFRIISDSLQCDFILYSPNYQHFISVLTYYQYRSNRTEHYDGLVLFCERKKNTIDIYPYTSPLNQYGGLSREDYLYKAVLHMRSSMGYHNGLSSKYTLNTDEFLEYPHPLKKAFWQDKYFFSIISIKGKKYLRYQTELWYNYSDSKYEYVTRPMYRIELDPTNL